MKACILAFAIGLLFAAQAYAEDFTITVPVSFTNLPPNIQSLWVACQVTEADTLHATAAASREIPISGGRYSGDVVIAMNAIPDRDPALAVQYRCQAWLFGQTATNPRQPYFGGASETYIQRFPLNPGAPLALDTGFVRLPGH